MDTDIAHYRVTAEQAGAAIETLRAFADQLAKTAGNPDERPTFDFEISGKSATGITRGHALTVWMHVVGNAHSTNADNGFALCRKAEAVALLASDIIEAMPVKQAAE